MLSEVDKFELLDQRDEEQILAEIKGQIITEMFYEINVGGKKITGISWVGTKEISRKYGGISMGVPHVDDLGECYAASVQATDKRNDVTLVGTALQPKNMTLKDGSVKPDPFAYTKATSKAQRNAIRALVPERYLIEMYQYFKNQKNGSKAASPERRFEPAVQSVDDGSGVFDLAGLNSFLLSNGVEVTYKDQVLTEESDGVLIVRSPAGSKMYEAANELLRGVGFEWVKGGYRWERVA